MESIAVNVPSFKYHYYGRAGIGCTVIGANFSIAPQIKKYAPTSTVRFTFSPWVAREKFPTDSTVRLI